MKIILIALFFCLSCSKTKYENVPPISDNHQQSSALNVSAQDYNPSIDIFVAFLWPEKIQAQEHKVELQKIIQLARELRIQKEIFQEIRFQLKNRYEEFDCPCILEARCNGTETHTDENTCLDLENEIIDHDRTLTDVYALVDQIKEKIHHIGGYWIKTNQDFPQLPASEFNFTSYDLNLTVFDSTHEQAVNYLSLKPEIHDYSNYQSLIFHFKNKADLGGNWIIEVAPTIKPYSLLFQGELYLESEDGRREGFIYWEHIKK
jgi:hypothetical protein